MDSSDAPTVIGPAGQKRRSRVARLLVAVLGLTLFIAGGLLIGHRRPRRFCGPPVPHPDSSFVGGTVLAKGEVLAGLLSRWCLEPELVNRVYAALGKTDFNFRGMREGDSVSFYYKGLSLTGLEYHKDMATSYRVAFDSNGGAAATKELKPVDTVQTVVRGTIKGSLWHSLLDLGEKPELVVGFADILRYDIDFFTESSDGDTFELLVDKLQVQGRLYRYGRIYALHYRGRTENVYGFYFRSPSGHWDYYNEKGQSLRKTVLRSPLQFSRVSSFFGMRFHPILRIWRPHQGVDYVAPKGTPVSAVADGTVTMASWNGGYGRMVEIRHSGGLVSRYGHLSGFGPGIRQGRYVRQGATVGYVGATGLATGPHLHFEIRKDGKPVNPLKVIPPRAEPVPKRLMPEFERVKNGYLARFSRWSAALADSAR
ncbi:MAG: peptidoglycan DD-metalloendopeptidase family protein [candidate division WOR-3 bacterium]